MDPAFDLPTKAEREEKRAKRITTLMKRFNCDRDTAIEFIELRKEKRTPAQAAAALNLIDSY